MKSLRKNQSIFIALLAVSLIISILLIWTILSSFLSDIFFLSQIKLSDEGKVIRIISNEILLLLTIQFFTGTILLFMKKLTGAKQVFYFNAMSIFILLNIILIPATFIPNQNTDFITAIAILLTTTIFAIVPFSIGFIISKMLQKADLK